MKFSVAYLRVSSDEQSEKYSLPEQRDVIMKYAERNNITILKFFEEDYTAKDGFNRPGWNELMKFLKQDKLGITEILMVKWSRFARNIMEAYIMISKLKAMGIIPNAIEEPIDFSIPTQKPLLAMYLVFPEVDNDVRGINTAAGLHRARMEGYWCTSAPIGYRFEKIDKKSMLVPDDRAHFVRKAYEEFAKGIYSAEHILHDLRLQGFQKSKSKMYEMLRNPVYKGMVYVKKYKDEPQCLVRGRHEPLVPEETWNRVQDVMNGRRRKPTKTITVSEDLPLRGSLLCSSCGQPLTGSGSRSKTGKIHFYYHCHRPCQERHRAPLVNEAVERELAALAIPEEVLQVVNLFASEMIKANAGMKKNMKAKLEKDIEDQRILLDKLEDKYINDQIDQDRYRLNLTRYRDTIQQLQYQHSKIDTNTKAIEQKISFCMSILGKLPEYYQNATAAIKKEFLSSTIPGKIVFDGNNCRTLGIHPIFDLFRLKNSQLQGLIEAKKSGTLGEVPLGTPNGTYLELFLSSIEDFYNKLHNLVEAEKII